MNLRLEIPTLCVKSILRSKKEKSRNTWQQMKRTSVLEMNLRHLHVRS